MKIVSDALKVNIPADLQLLFEEQLEFFHSISGGKTELRSSLETYEHLFLAKLSYAKLIKSQQVQSCLATESIGPHLVEMPCMGRLKFNYQRVDSQILSYDLSSFYSLNKEVNVANFFWTSTCQGAISSIFLAMQRQLRKVDVVLPFGAYWESLGFVALFEFDVKTTPEDPNYIIYLDSSTAPPDWFKKVEPFLHDAQWIIVDTTCWELNTEDFSLFLSYVAEKKIGPIILVRSHQKLDCLGLEYGRLGSVVIIDQTQMISERFLPILKDIFAWQGVYAHSEQLYPFFSEKNFSPLSKKWLAAVRNSNKSLMPQSFSSLSRNRNIEIQEFGHQKFFWVRFKMVLSEESINFFSKKLSIILRALDLPHMVIASYPWDFISITFFRERHLFSSAQRGQQVLRVSLPPLTDPQLSCFRQGFQFWLEWIEKNCSFEQELV